MGVTKSNLFTTQQNKLSVLLKALAHPARIAILQYLSKAKTCICGDLVEELGLAQATISQHLKELKTAGFIKGTIEGASICYCINNTVWEECKLMLDQLFTQINTDESCC
ncbi:MAG TPA: metalloregulator ArsR/SmtB family transcription factor [Daejeonella sp.]|nr:metalloregulator ArsR/SmtB family transcription factor [Daejeonella sp.]